MARALIIANPHTRGGGPTTIRVVADELARAGWQVDAVEAGEPVALRRLSSEAVRDDRELVIAVGGDGTVIEVASPLIGTQVTLGIVPGGTGNLLARNLGIPLKPAAAAGAIVAGRSRRIDLGRVEIADRVRHFAIACGAGFDARVMDATHPMSKRRWGRVAYIATAVALSPRVRSVPHVITVDGVRRETEAVEVLVANVGEIVPNFVRPRLPIVPDDGLLDVIVVRGRGPFQAVRGAVEALLYAAPGEHPGGRVIRLAAREVRVEADPAQAVELDGDVWGMTPFTASVVPSAISVMVPRQA